MLNTQQVMVVDDDPAMRSFLRAFLSERGYEAVTVGNAPEAVTRFYTERPAAVILDVVMPGMGGLEALAAFKNIDRDVPVIVLSGQGLAATVVQAMKLGASDFVCKPFDEADLDVPLAQALQQRQLSREVEELESERKLIFEMLELTRGNRKTTAEVLGISEKALLYKMEQHGLER